MSSPGYWLTFSVGALAQTLFAVRILIQWIATERLRRVSNPLGFWIFSYLGCLAMFAYGWMRDDFAIMAGQFISYYIYVWNLDNKHLLDGLGRKLRKALTLVICLIPLAVVLRGATDWETVRSSLFSRESIALRLVVFGTAGQLVWSFRLIYQFIYSYRRGESRLPLGFWLISLAGALMIISYAVIRRDVVLAVGQTFSTVPIIRNLHFIWKNRNR